MLSVLRRSGGGCMLRKSCEINAITFSTMKREVQSLKSELLALRTGHLSTSEVRQRNFDTSLTVTPSMTTGVKSA